MPELFLTGIWVFLAKVNYQKWGRKLHLFSEPQKKNSSPNEQGTDIFVSEPTALLHHENLKQLCKILSLGIFFNMQNHNSPAIHLNKWAKLFSNRESCNLWLL